MSTSTKVFVHGNPETSAIWSEDCAGLLHPEYQWHDAAQGWQAPELGEQMVAGMVAMPDDHFAGTEEMMTEVAHGVGAKIAQLSGVGHWWMCEKPQEAARVLLSHWAQ